MSRSIPRRARHLVVAGLASLGLAAVQLAVSGSVTAADTPYETTLHQSPPIKNSTFEDDEGDCPGSPAMWGWHFILTGGEAQFAQLTTTFQTAGTITTTSFGPPDAKHAYVYTATDDTLLSASALVNGGDPSKVRLVLSHTCDGGGVTSTPTPTPSESVSPTPTETPSPTESVSPTPTETPSPTESVSPTPTETETPTPTVSPTETETPSPTVSPTETETPSPTVSPTETETPSPSVSPTVLPTETETATPSPTVSGTRLTRAPTPSISPSVRGVKRTRAPQVGGSGLPSTGTVVPVGLLLVLGFGLVGAGVVMTVSSEPAAVRAGGRHRR